MLHQGLPGIPLLRSMWRSGSEWERMVDAWRTSGPAMEGTRVHFNLVASSTNGRIASRASAESLTIRVAFFGPAIYRNPSP